VHAEFMRAHGVSVSANLVNLLTHNAAITRLPGPDSASRKAGVHINDDVSMSLSHLRGYLSDNFSFNPTKQELYWLICRYLFSKFPGFRDCNLT